jgi:Arc/MetJ-type ribon-helix-helix transcriptional regulator
MAHITITVDDALRVWIEKRVEAGGYADVSAYLCDLIRQDLQANGFALPDSDHDGASEQRGVTPSSTV